MTGRLTLAGVRRIVLGHSCLAEAGYACRVGLSCSHSGGGSFHGEGLVVWLFTLQRKAACRDVTISDKIENHTLGLVIAAIFIISI